MVFAIGHYQLVSRYISLFDFYDLHTKYNNKNNIKVYRRDLHSNNAERPDGNVTPQKKEKEDPKPKLWFPREYHVKGILKLPYGSIVEPFEAWYSGPHRMSRIDYYGGEGSLI